MADTASVLAQAQALLQQAQDDKVQSDKVAADVTTVVGLLQALTARISELIAAGGAQPAALQAIADTLAQAQTTLSASKVVTDQATSVLEGGVTANTPV